MKQRLTAIDIRALVMTLKRKIKSLRIANIYDISNKLYLFKLAAKGNKEFLLVEAGIRMHTTEFVRNKNSIPSGFTMKLRKHLRTKRVEDIRQVGIDRVVDITLGQGDNAYHILIEFYASGNLILTDSSYTIISLLRTHRYDEDTRCAVGEPYPFTNAANIDLDSIVSSKVGIENMLQEAEEKKEGDDQAANKKGKKKKKRRGEGGIKDTLIKMVPYMTPLMAEHCMEEVGIDANEDFDIEDDELVDKCIKAALLCKDMVKSLENMETVPGYIIYEEVEDSQQAQDEELFAKVKKDNTKKGQNPENEEQREKLEKELDLTSMEEMKQKVQEEKDKIYKQHHIDDSDDEGPTVDPDVIFKGKKVKEFICFQLNQMKQQKSLEFDWFDECVDLYFTQIDKQKEETKMQQKEADIYKKMNRIKNDQLKRIEGLQKEQDSSIAKAKLLQNNIHEVQAILEILSALLQSGLQWKEIWRMIKEEKRAGNPLANLIHGLDLEREKAILIFNLAEIQSSENVDDFFSDLIDEVIMKVDLDLKLSAQANIQKYFEIKKKTQDKELRTKDKANDAIKQAEDQARKALMKTRNEQKLKTTRKPYWFEKYDWFISSENYLIISGKNAQQNEEIVKTYLEKRDVYVHSEMAGSASCIIKNPSLGEVSPLTLNECGTWAICHSKSWDMKIVTSAFWVWGDQVSKTPQSGEFLVTGSFMIRGKKNYVNPQRLELGCTVMFKLAEESVANHIGERKNRLEMGEEGKVEEVYQQQDTYEETKEEVDDIEEANEDTEEVETQEETKEEIIGEDPEEQKEESKPDEEDQNEESDGEGEGEGDDQDEPWEDTHSRADTEKTDSKKEKVNVQNLPRGKKTKLKKRQKKYADQDPEDKKALMELIGAKDMELNATKKKTKQENEQYYKGEKQDPKNKGQKQQNQKQKGQSKDQKGQSKDQKGQSKDQKPQSNPQNQPKEKLKNQPKKDNSVKFEKHKSQTADDKEEIAKIMEEENIKMPVSTADISVLDQLTGTPKPGDTLLFAVPMCAPYTMINNHKYKVKILPGQLKRGKARKLVHEIFSSVAKGNEVETVLVKGIPEEQLLEVLPKGSQVLAAGLNKLKQNKKANKKQKKKNQGK